MASGSRDEVIRFVFETTGDKQLADAVGTLVDAGKAGGEASEELKGLVDQLAALGRQSDAIKAFTKSKADLAELTTKLGEAKAGLAALDAEFGKSDDSSRSVSAAYKRAEKAVADLATEQKAAQLAFSKAQGTLQKAGIDTNNLAAANAALKEKSAGVAQQIKDAGDAAKRGGDAMSGAAKGAKDLGEQSHKSGGLIAELKEHLVEIVSVATAVELALKGIEFGKESFKGAADVEQALARVKAIADTTAQSFGELQEQIEKSAIAANVTSTEAANAAAALAEQGQSADEIISTLTPTLLLAKDAAIDLGQAAGIVDDALDLFGKNASDASLMVDQLVAASKGSKEGLAGMATALRTLAPDARELGISFEQLVGMLGVFGQNGIDAGKAARGLRTIFQQLQDPTSQFSIALNALGDSSGNFTTAIETLRNSGANGRQALLGLDGAARSLVEFLLQQGPGAIDAFTASLNNANGAASRTAAVLDNTLTGAFTSFENAIDRIGAALLGTSLEPFRAELQKLAGQLNDFARSPAFDGLKENLRTLFEEGTQAFDNFIQSVDWDRFVTGARAAISDAASSISSFKNDIKGVGEALNEVGAIVGVVYRSIAVVFDLAKVGISKMVADKIAPLAALSEALDGLRGSSSQLTIALESIRDAAKDATEKGVAALASNAGKLAENLKVAGGAAEDAGKKVKAFGADFGNVQSGVKSTADAFEEFSQVGPPTLDELHDSAKKSGDAFQGLQQQIIAARQRVDEARKTMDALATSGNTNAEAFLAAQIAWQKAQEQLDALTGKAQSAADNSRKLEQAFTSLRISSQADLDKAAKAAKDNFDVIYAAFQKGAATIEDVRRAFRAYVDAQRASVADSDAAAKAQVESQLAVLASVLGLTDAYKAAGDAGAKAGEDAAKGFNKSGDAAEKAKESAKGYKDALDDAKTSASAHAEVMSGIVALTSEQNMAMRALNAEIAKGYTYQTVSLGVAKQALEQLGPLLGAGEQILRQRIEALNDAAERAKQVAQDMADQAADLQDQIDQEQGKQDDIEDRRHAKKLADIKEEAELNGTLNTAAYRKLIELENELHDVKMKNIKKQADATSAANTGSGAGSSLQTGYGTLPAPSRGDQPIHFNPVIQNVDAKALAKSLAPYLPANSAMTPDQIIEKLLGKLQSDAAASGSAGFLR